jgi:hypothetical protein
MSKEPGDRHIFFNYEEYPEKLMAEYHSAPPVDRAVDIRLVFDVQGQKAAYERGRGASQGDRGQAESKKTAHRPTRTVQNTGNIGHVRGAVRAASLRPSSFQ